MNIKDFGKTVVSSFNNYMEELVSLSKESDKDLMFVIGLIIDDINKLLPENVDVLMYAFMKVRELYWNDKKECFKDKASKRDMEGVCKFLLLEWMQRITYIAKRSLLKLENESEDEYTIRLLDSNPDAIKNLLEKNIHKIMN